MDEGSYHEIRKQNLSTRRRKAFVGMGAVLGGTALALTGARGAVEGAKDAEQLLENEPKLQLPVKIGNLEMFPLPVPHGGNYWDRWKGKIKPIVDKFPLVIPE